MKAASSGDLALAKQILTEHISNPIRRLQAMRSVDQQAIYGAINSGKIEEALRGINNIRSPKNRATMMILLVNQMSGNQKRATLLDILEQARELIASSGKG